MNASILQLSSEPYNDARGNFTGEIHVGSPFQETILVTFEKFICILTPNARRV